MESEKITDQELEMNLGDDIEDMLFRYQDIKSCCDAERSPEKKKMKMSLGESRSDVDDRESRLMKGLLHAPLLDSSDEELPYSDKVKYGKYEAQMVSSGGFDIDSCPQLFPCTLAPINPMKLQDEEYQKLCTFSELGIKQYNTDNGTHFGFVKYVKAVWALCSGEKYYITFEAKEHKEDPPTIFQALVYNGIPITDLIEDVQVLLVRKKSDATREDNRILLC